MLSCALYKVTACQVYERERRLKIYSILKHLSKQSSFNSTSLKGFIDTITSTFKEDELNINLDTFLPIFEQHTEEPPLSIIQSLAFIGGYAVHSLFKKSKQCLIILTEDKVNSLIMNLHIHLLK